MGKEFSSAVVVASNTGIIGMGSLYGALTIGAIATEVKVGATKLSGRKSVTLNAHPDNTGYIFVGLDNTVSAAKYFYVLTGGSGISIELDSSTNPDVYVYGSAAGQVLGVMEGLS